MYRTLPKGNLLKILLSDGNISKIRINDEFEVILQKSQDSESLIITMKQPDGGSWQITFPAARGAIYKGAPLEFQVNEALQEEIHITQLELDVVGKIEDSHTEEA